MGAIWRLIPPFEAPGWQHMAVDAWLLRQCAQGRHPPVLRFYTWSPAALSLGYHQQHWPPHWHQLQWQGCPLPLVRRPTGGRGVLHQGDLTYAVVCPSPTGHRRQTYEFICEFLIRGWQTLGFSLDYGQGGRGYAQQPHCFGTATTADLVLSNGTKWIGSAQAWSRQTVLQHGSIRLNPDPHLWQQVFCEPLPPPLDSEIPHRSEVSSTLTAAAEDWFQVQFQIQPLSVAELAATSVGALD
ncbi:lipoate--protein ligase family protein [Synechococcales cyanobacterium C]|uniref:Lipoate--protein ligase family protein n=1 Tax=Petrachloros mirabilis ULC683 TaxID=2781853 RepID=A0A8K2A9M4_9CYAN|nr:lipoate--protein ligase family protein [Petrachloros mirabilis]NCJ08180.1 lipoate--protein ligase family protein [Petrachloros mirabilis ULC683]